MGKVSNQIVEQSEYKRYNFLKARRVYFTHWWLVFLSVLIILSLKTKLEIHWIFGFVPRREWVSTLKVDRSVLDFYFLKIFFNDRKNHLTRVQWSSNELQWRKKGFRDVFLQTRWHTPWSHPWGSVPDNPRGVSGEISLLSLGGGLFVRLGIHNSGDASELFGNGPCLYGVKLHRTTNLWQR